MPFGATRTSVVSFCMEVSPAAFGMPKKLGSTAILEAMSKPVSLAFLNVQSSCQKFPFAGKTPFGRMTPKAGSAACKS